MIDLIQDFAILILGIGLGLNAWWDHKDRMAEDARWLRHWQEHDR